MTVVMTPAARQAVRNEQADPSLGNGILFTPINALVVEYINLMTNPSFELGMTNWAANAGNGSAVVSQDAAGANNGAFGAKAVTAGGGSNEGIVSLTSAVAVANLIYTASVWVEGAVGGEPLQLVINERTAADANVGTTSTSFTGTTTGRRYAVSRTFGATGEKARIIVRTSATAAVTFYIDGAQIAQTASAIPYIDGDQPGCWWSGAPHASQSNYGPSTSGCIAWDWDRKAYDLMEANVDGGVLTKDRALASALRGVELFTEAQL